LFLVVRESSKRFDLSPVGSTILCLAANCFAIASGRAG